MTDSANEDKPLVLISGASGFIAGHIVNQALEDGYRVRGTVRSLAKPEKYQNLIDKGVELVEANLTSPDGWDKALAGCQFVLHTASPFTSSASEEELIGPAVNGTRYVLEAAANTPTVERVVVTASCACVSYGHPVGSKPEGYKYGPDDWSVKENLDAYSKSKTMAEEFAWQFKKENDECKFELTTVCPAFVMGPLTQNKHCESADIVHQIMLGELPMLPNIAIGVVDVRDVALIHVRALTAPEAPGKRLISSPKTYWFPEIGAVLGNKYTADGWPVTTRTAPNFLVKGMALFNAQMALISPDLGNPREHDVSETERVIGLQWRDTDQSFYDMVESQIELGMLEKPQGGGCIIL